MRTLLYIFSVRNAIKRKKDLFSLKRSATCAIAKNNLLKRFATSARAEVAQLALCASNCEMPTSGEKYNSTNINIVEFHNLFRFADTEHCFDLLGFISAVDVTDIYSRRYTSEKGFFASGL